MPRLTVRRTVIGGLVIAALLFFALAAIAQNPVAR